MTSIEEIRWHPYRMPLKREFISAHSALTERRGAILELVTDGGASGVGEIAPPPGFGGESFDSMLAALPTWARWLRGMTLSEALHAVEARLAADLGAGPVTCGLEIALLDALGKSEGRGVSAILCGGNAQPRPGVRVNAVVGARTTEEAAAEARKAVADGFSCVKLKVGWEREIERIAAVREAIGPGVHLRLDANEGWSLEQAMTILARSARFDIQYVEQPVRAGDLEAMRLLRRAALVPIAADESLGHLESAYRILESEAADVLIIKPQLLGGLRASLRLMRDAAERGTRSVVTSSIEAGIGLAAALHLAAAFAASPQLTMECGLATLHLLEDDLLLDELPIRDGFLAVPAGSGLGVRLDGEALERYRWGGEGWSARREDEGDHKGPSPASQPLPPLL